MNDKNKMEIIRTAAGSGQWFPASQQELSSVVSAAMANASIPPQTNRIVAAIAPHAGYRFSANVAGYTFRAIKDAANAGHKPDLVVILGFSHRQSFPGVAIMDGDALQTPLGKVQLDAKAIATLTSASERIFSDYRPHNGEHSAENLVPFVQVALPDTPVVIALIGDHDLTTIKELQNALAQLATDRKVLVASSTDMLHHSSWDLVTKTDKNTLKKLESMNIEGVIASWTGDHQVFCGIMPVIAAMTFAKSQSCDKASILHYRNSGDDNPESRGQWVVGYGAAIFTSTTSE